MTDKLITNEFLLNRTSWKWFERRLDKNPLSIETQQLLQLQILKELQFMNNLTIDKIKYRKNG